VENKDKSLYGISIVGNNIFLMGYFFNDDKLEYE